MMLKFLKGEEYESLAGINMEFDQVRMQVLGKVDVPSLNEVFYLIQAEEGRRNVMLDSPTSEGSALVATMKPSSNNYGSSEQNQDNKESYKSPINKDDLWCNYCKKNQRIPMRHARNSRETTIWQK